MSPRFYNKGGCSTIGSTAGFAGIVISVLHCAVLCTLLITVRTALYCTVLYCTVVGGNSQTGKSRGRESMGIPREFPFQKWRFLGIPRNSHTGEVYWLYRGDFYLQGGICFFICIRY